MPQCNHKLGGELKFAVLKVDWYKYTAYTVKLLAGNIETVQTSLRLLWDKCSMVQQLLFSFPTHFTVTMADMLVVVLLSCAQQLAYSCMIFKKLRWQTIMHTCSVGTLPLEVMYTNLRQLQNHCKRTWIWEAWTCTRLIHACCSCFVACPQLWSATYCISLNRSPGVYFLSWPFSQANFKNLTYQDSNHGAEFTI